MSIKVKLKLNKTFLLISNITDINMYIYNIYIYIYIYILVGKGAKGSSIFYAKVKKYW